MSLSLPLLFLCVLPRANIYTGFVGYTQYFLSQIYTEQKPQRQPFFHHIFSSLCFLDLSLNLQFTREKVSLIFGSCKNKASEKVFNAPNEQDEFSSHSVGKVHN